jgi:hypothetical protein
MFIESRKTKQKLTAIKNNTYFIPKKVTKNEFAEWLTKTLSFSGKSNRDAFIVKSLNSIPDDTEEIDTEMIRREIERFIVSEKKNQTAGGILCMIITGVMIWVLY